MDSSTSDIKVRVAIAGADEDDHRDEDLSTKEAQVVKAKLDAHHIKRMSTLLKVSSLATVDGMLSRLLKSQLFQQPDGDYVFDVCPLVLHGGIWRWMPDFALKAVPAETGRLHLGCLLGPYIVDWTDSSLVAIRTLASCEPLVLVRLASERLYSGASPEGVDKLLRAAAALIVEWNTTRKFDTKKNSAIAFVTELFAAVGARVAIAAPIHSLLSDVQKSNKLDLTFFADWAVAPGDKKAKKVKFKTHAEMDEWVLARRKEHPNLETEHPNDWNTLLLLDRFCWCGAEGTDQETMDAKDKPRAEGCPFGPPAFHKVMEMDLGGGPKRGQMVKKKSEKSVV